MLTICRKKLKNPQTCSMLTMYQKKYQNLQTCPSKQLNTMSCEARLKSKCEKVSPFKVTLCFIFLENKSLLKQKFCFPSPQAQVPQNIHSSAVEGDLIGIGLGTTVAFDFSSYMEKKDEKIETNSTHLCHIQRNIVFS